MHHPFEPWHVGQARVERLRREAEMDRLLAEAGIRSSIATRLFSWLSALLSARGGRLTASRPAPAPRASDVAPVPVVLPARQRIALNGASLASLRGELLASEFASAEASSVVVVRVELLPEARVSVFCWDSSADGSRGERQVALVLTAPAAPAR